MRDESALPESARRLKRLLSRLGYHIREVKQGCCGALHAHNGELKTAQEMASNLIQSMPNDIPVIVNSAGCGSTMKEYKNLVDQDLVFSSRVFDLSEFLFNHGLCGPSFKVPTSSAGEESPTMTPATYRMVQKITDAPRELLKSIPGAEFAELPESMMCCGSAGIYNVIQPEMARRLLDRKVGHIESTGATIVATGNPGCHGWIQQGCEESRGPLVLHTAELLEAAFIGLDYFVNHK